MECILEIKLGLSDAIALGALILAGLSALYARWSLNEAKKANKISLLSYRKEVYDAFFELKMHMIIKAEFAELGEVSKFYYPSKNAKFYFSSALAQDIEMYYEACLGIANPNRNYGRIPKEEYVETEIRLSSKMDNDITKLLHPYNNKDKP